MTEKKVILLFHGERNRGYGMSLMTCIFYLCSMTKKLRVMEEATWPIYYFFIMMTKNSAVIEGVSWPHVLLKYSMTKNNSVIEKHWCPVCSILIIHDPILLKRGVLLLMTKYCTPWLCCDIWWWKKVRVNEALDNPILLKREVLFLTT